jgi:hypothetical protein
MAFYYMFIVQTEKKMVNLVSKWPNYELLKSSVVFSIAIGIPCPLLNVITLRPSKIDNINLMKV